MKNWLSLIPSIPRGIPHSSRPLEQDIEESFVVVTEPKSNNGVIHHTQQQLASFWCCCFLFVGQKTTTKTDFCEGYLRSLFLVFLGYVNLDEPMATTKQQQVVVVCPSCKRISWHFSRKIIIKKIIELNSFLIRKMLFPILGGQDLDLFIIIWRNVSVCGWE